MDIDKDELLDAAKENQIVSVVGHQLLLSFGHMTLSNDDLDQDIPLQLMPGAGAKAEDYVQPTFILRKGQQTVDHFVGADPVRLQSALNKLA